MKYSVYTFVFMGIASSAVAVQAQTQQFQIQDAEGNLLSGAVITASVPQPVENTTNSTYEVVQRERQFDPQVLLINQGDLVYFPNHDRIRHHVYSFSEARTFEFELYGGDVSPNMDFPEPGLVVLGCNIHDDMVAYIVINDGGPAVMTDELGEATLQTGGITRFDIWHPWLLEQGQSKVTLETSDYEGTISVQLPVTEPEKEEESELESRFRRFGE
ncbi:methylamine utilization protein [Aliidiomarina minuta]|uniref:Methylamine utilization protein n=1 Tax=Aliidiomarina minuta TaxID=880057 RepID=A0A432W5N1_9GAMM|nr:methylamine utilization protein [Aliidiomarina minuta]RUO25296.1 methylamine utilization protein [Aliidiomarina minuta]